MNTTDTIAAPASATGGAITVIRVSGPEALSTGNAVWHGGKPLSAAHAREMLLGRLGDDPALAVYMPGPRSYTGDDVVELHCHGGAAAADHAMKCLLSSGCRLAEPGEFTFRAFVHGKMDLLQAEAVVDVISSGSESARQLAERQLAGTLSARFDALFEQVTALRAECESRLDFPDEELDFDPEVPQKLAKVQRELRALLATRRAGAALREGVRVVLAGKPNAGKSSLLNALLGYDRAIVSATPGTTRDTVEVQSALHGIPVQLTDTAGLREGTDEIERQGVERSRRSIAAAQCTFWVLDASAAELQQELETLPARLENHCFILWNKCDLAPDRALPEISGNVLRISARTGEGLPELQERFAAWALSSQSAEVPEVAVNARAAALLETAEQAVERAAEQFTAGALELASRELASADFALGSITGRSAAPDLLDTIFHRFCIGK